MNYTFAIPSSIRKTTVLLAIISLLASSLSIGVSTALAANIYTHAGDTVSTSTPFVSDVIDASSYEDLNLSFHFDATELDLGAPQDSFSYGWREGVAGTDQELGEFLGLAGASTTAEIGDVSVPLPPEAQVSELVIYIKVDANTASDEVVITDLVLEGDEIVTSSPTYVFPSTNDENRTNGHPHVNLVSTGIEEATLEFVNTTNSLARFEIRIDGATVGSTEHPVVTGDVIHPGPCVDGRTTPNPAQCADGAGPRVVAYQASSTVEVRLALGGERDWDFDWTSFAVLPAPAPKDEELIVINGDTAAGENESGWLFNRDSGTATPFGFNEDEASIGSGSLYVLPIGSTTPSDKFIAEYFALTEMGDVDSFSYDFNMGSGATSTDAVQFYLNVYANFASSSPTKFYDCRYNIVPATGVVGGWTTVTFDPTVSYPVIESDSSPSTCPASPAAMGTDATIRVFAINLGDTSATDEGIDGYFDNVVFETGAKITTFDFEPAVEDDEEENDENDDDRSNLSGGSVGGGGGGPTPQILGASTDAEILALLNAIEVRLYELMAEANSVNPTPIPPTTTGVTTTPPSPVVEEEEEVMENNDDDTPVITETEEETEETAADIPWVWIAWILVALWLIASAAAYWHRSRNPGSLAMRMVQGVFGTIGLALLVSFFLFGLVGALFWPALILGVGATTAYFWTLE